MERVGRMDGEGFGAKMHQHQQRHRWLPSDGGLLLRVVDRSFPSQHHLPLAAALVGGTVPDSDAAHCAGNYHNRASQELTVSETMTGQRRRQKGKGEV